MKQPILQMEAETRSWVIICEKHGRVQLDEQTQEALSGLSVDHVGLVYGSSGRVKQHTACPKCKAEVEAAKEAEKKMTAIKEVRKKAGIPQRFKDMRLNTCPPTNQKQKVAFNIADDYISSFPENTDMGTSMIFGGPPGTGKTHLAAAILNGIIDLGFTGRYTTGLALKQAVQETYAADYWFWMKSISCTPQRTHR
jgi:DNA replication protein DnaC